MKRRDFLGFSLGSGLAARTSVPGLWGGPVFHPLSRETSASQAPESRAEGASCAPFPIGLHAQLPLPAHGRQLARRSDGIWYFVYASHTHGDSAGNYAPATDIRIRASSTRFPCCPEDFGPEHVLVRRVQRGYLGERLPSAGTGGYLIEAESGADTGTRPAIAVDPTGVLHLTWVRPAAGEIWYSRCDVSSDAQAVGRTGAWRKGDGRSPGAELIAGPNSDLGDFCLDRESRPCLLYRDEEGVRFACYEDGRWRRVLIARGSGLRWPILALDPLGTLHAVFVTSGGLIHYLRSADGGLRWTGADGGTQEPDLVAGYCSRPPALAACGEVLIAHYQGFRVISFSRFDGRRWTDNIVVPGSYEHTSPMLTADRHDVIWMHMVSRRYPWSRMCRWLGEAWSDLQQGRHLQDLGQSCSAERMMLRDAGEFGVILADRSHRLHFDTIAMPVPTVEAESRVQFLDLWEVSTLRGVVQVVEPMDKDSRNPVLEHGKPGSWDAMQANLQGTVIREGDRYRLWYTGLDRKPYFDFYSACGYAESRDGVNWTKPSLGLYPYNGSLDNNICFPYGFHFCVLPMPEELEKDPGKRYRMAFTADNVLLAFSGDGTRWTLGDQNPLWKTEGGNRCPWCGGDNVTYIYDPHDPDPKRRFKAYPQVWVGDKSRVAGLLVSPNGIRFRPYENNPVLDADLGVEAEHHMIQVCWLHHGLFIGLYGCYLDNVNVDARLAVSRDGIHWVTVKNEVPFLATGAPGSWDAGMVFPANYPIIEGEDIWIYYSGVERNFTSGEEHASVGRARVRLDGFAHMELRPQSREGSLTTVPFQLRRGQPTRLVVNADRLSSQAPLRVEVLDAAMSHVLPGFSAADCQPLTREGVALPVSWRGGNDLGAVDIDRVRFRFHLSRSPLGSTRLYSFGFEAAE